MITRQIEQHLKLYPSHVTLPLTGQLHQMTQLKTTNHEMYIFCAFYFGIIQQTPVFHPQEHSLPIDL